MKFDLENEPYSQKSIDILKYAGINFEKLKTNGCDSKIFAKLIIKSSRFVKILFL